jgi:hypothetical protein
VREVCHESVSNTQWATRLAVLAEVTDLHIIDAACVRAWKRLTARVNKGARFSMETNLIFAQNVLKGILALDQPLGRLMEMAAGMSETADKATIKECCGEMLRLQYDLVSKITRFYPQLKRVDDVGAS